MRERILEIEGMVQVTTNKQRYTREFDSLEDLATWLDEVFDEGGAVWRTASL